MEGRIFTLPIVAAIVGAFLMSVAMFFAGCSVRIGTSDHIQSTDSIGYYKGAINGTD